MISYLEFKQMFPGQGGISSPLRATGILLWRHVFFNMSMATPAAADASKYPRRVAVATLPRLRTGQVVASFSG